MTARCSHRVTKAGPPLHSQSVFCVDGRHILCMVDRNGMEPTFSVPVPCDGSCKGYIRLGERAAVWISSLAARGMLTAFALGSGSDDK